MRAVHADLWAPSRPPRWMELLPPVGWGDGARRVDVEAHRVAARGEMAELRRERAELRAEMAKLSARIEGLLLRQVLADVPLAFAVAGLA
ncbi:MAG: hypothetical protein H0U41_06080 [Actinobacteria bacterium]|nr:hypothetical protein [Actinomycetota bacterium]